MIVRVRFCLLTVFVATSLKEISCTDPQDTYLDIPKKTVYSGAMIRLKSLETNCWLDIRPQKFPKKDADGTVSSGGFVAACVPTHPTLPKKEFSNYEEELMYEADGPFFKIVTPDQDVKSRKLNVDNLVKMSHSNTVHLIMEKSQGSCLACTGAKAPVSSIFAEVSGMPASSHSEECGFRMFIEDGGDIMEGKMVNLQHAKSEQILSLSGRNLSEAYGDGYQEVITFRMDQQDITTEGLDIWVVDKVKFGEDIDIIDEDKFEAVYNDGSTKKQVAGKAVSNDDMRILHKVELDLVKNILKVISKDELNKILDKYGFSTNVIEKTDIKHPVDIYNLIKRTALQWRKIDDKHVKNVVEKVESQFSNWDEVKEAAALGLLNLEVQYGLEPAIIVKGILNFDGKTYRAASKLRVEDVELVADMAASNRFLDSQIIWYKTFPELVTEFRRSIRIHNEMVADPTALVGNRYSTFNMPVDEDLNLNSKLTVEGSLAKLAARCLRQVKANSAEKYYCEHLFLRDPIKAHCQGEIPSPEEGEFTCNLLTYDDPYLRLGPFQLELHSNQPIVGQIHNYMFASEIEQLHQETSGQESSPSYDTWEKNVDKEQSIEKITKIKYFSERKHSLSRKLSDRMGLALAMNLFNSNYRYTSENYQVMSYGLGGQVAPHQDAIGLPVLDEMLLGGGRVTSSTAFLSDVEAGGKFVFPYLNVGVSPAAGSLLYWTTKTNSGSTDYRMKHVECPVIYGTKWVAKKKINWREQMNRFPCSVDLEKRMFESPHTNISYSNPLHSNLILSA